MKLSEAIREGAKMAPQVRQLKTYGPGGEINGTCALGAAAHYVGKLTPRVNTEAVTLMFPVARQRLPIGFVPAQYLTMYPLDTTAYMHSVITTLNDEFHWSREAIAEWVETIENKLEAEAKKCAECGEVRKDDDRVGAGMKCGPCAYA